MNLFEELQSKKGSYTKCSSCGDDFTKENVHTEAGWRETQLSGLCENCWDETMAQDDIIDDFE